MRVPIRRHLPTDWARYLKTQRLLICPQRSNWERWRQSRKTRWWRQARCRARRLAESILEHDPAHYAAGSMVASMLAVEDREEEALELLGMLESVHPSQYGLPLMRVSILRSLGLTVQAEEALAQAAVIQGRVR